MGHALLQAGDEALRGELTRLIAERGHAPPNAELAARLGKSEADIEAGLRRLHDTHSLLLHPHACRPWVVHPFALSAGACWVRTDGGGYWANCLYCAFGIVAALDRDAEISTRLAGEAEFVRYRIRSGKPESTRDVFHLSTPPAHWWDNVIAACASFHPFRAEADIDTWCARHALPRGAVLDIPALWNFARDWYGGYVREPWRKRTVEEVREVFTRHQLTSTFWRI